jgi:hypothetical protein
MTGYHPLASPGSETPRGPTTTPGLPDRTQETPPVPPIIKPIDDVNPNDPPLPSITPPGGGGVLR